MLSLRSFLIEAYRVFLESAQSLLPILCIIGVFQWGILSERPDDIMTIGIGIFAIWCGLSVFLLGLKYGIFPLGERMTSAFIDGKKKNIVLLFGFLIGFSATITEPTLSIIAEKASIASQGRIDTTVLRYTVAFAVGLGILVGLWRIFAGIPLRKIFLVTHTSLIILTLLAPSEIIGLSFDLGGAAVSTITVPLLAAMGMTLARSIPGRSPLLDGFGLIALAGVFSMFFVKLYGILVFSIMETPPLSISGMNTAYSTIYDVSYFLTGLWNTIYNILPIIIIIFSFQYFILKEKLSFRELLVYTFGIWGTIFGLYTFLIGLDIGLLALGDSLAQSFVEKGDILLILLFSLCIGFGTSIAEPGVMNTLKLISSASGNAIHLWTSRIVIGMGVGVGLSVASLAIIYHLPLHILFVILYTLIVILTYIMPENFIATAYDSGVLTTSTVTVPLIASLSIGLASGYASELGISMAFGMVGFACGFPILFFQIYSLVRYRRMKH